MAPRRMDSSLNIFCIGLNAKTVAMQNGCFASYTWRQTLKQPNSCRASSNQNKLCMLDLLYRVMQPFAIYRGVVITQTNGFYKALGCTYQNLQQAKDAVDKAFNAIAASLAGSD